MPDQLEKVAIDWKSLFERMNIGFSIQKLFFDENGKPIDLEYIDINPSFEKITGLKRENTVGQRTSKLIPNLEQAVYDYYGDVVRSGNPVTFEQFVVGLGVYFKVYAFKTGENEFGTVFEDITQSKKEKDEREKETALLNALIDSMSDYIFYKNKEGVYQLCNNSFSQQFVGKPREEIINHTDKEIFSASDQVLLDFVLEQDKKVYESGVAVKYDWEIKLPNGKLVSLETLKTPLVDNKGNLLGLVGVSRDITSRVNTEKKLSEQLRQLELMNKLMIDRELKMIELKKNLAKLNGEIENEK